jgi:predicted CoA-binding protein
MEYDNAFIAEILKESKTLAVVGLSSKKERSSYSVAAHLQSNGYRIVPVYPREEVILNEKVYRSLSEIPFAVDVVVIFRKSEDVLPVVQEAILIKPKTIWMQQGIENNDAAALAEQAGVKIVMDRCMSLEFSKWHVTQAPANQTE